MIAKNVCQVTSSKIKQKLVSVIFMIRNVSPIINEQLNVKFVQKDTLSTQIVLVVSCHPTASLQMSSI